MKNLIACVLALPLLLVSCQENEIASTPEQETSLLKQYEQNIIKIDINRNDFASRSSQKKENSVDQMSSINELLLEYNIQIVKSELLGAEGAGITIRYKDTGNKQLMADFVPNDPRNFVPGTTDIPYWADGTELETLSGMSKGQTLGAINNAMNTWGTASCSDGLGLLNLGITSAQDYGDVGAIQAFRGFGGQPWFLPGTILHGGILPAEYFDTLRPGGGNTILAVTHTSIWYSDGIPTDIDNNGKYDVAFREIYYNNGYVGNPVPWQDAPNDIPGNGIVDFETVALHEAGHGLSQGHFGKSFIDKKGKIHFAPRAVMNSGEKGAQRTLLGTDNAGHCSNWANWPNK